MKLEVCIDHRGATYVVGRLHADPRSTAVTFEYATAWLAAEDAFSIDPTSLPLRAGPQHSSALFGAIQDCGPDRWGRVLIERAVRKKLYTPKPFSDIDHVIALDDATRLGALRFRLDADSPFLASSSGKLPPLVKLAALMRAADAIHGETESAADLRFLLGAGSPLGGARPKSAVSLPDGRIGLAKFPKPDDVRDIAAGEILALTLARDAGVNVAEHQLARVGRQSVAVITRFDRSGEERLPFLSAASLLGLRPGENGSYTMIAEAIRQFGDAVPSDLRELWRRLVFSLLASNYDDHAKNHGFLMRNPGRWSLSPAYDLNPVPEVERARMNKTSITEENHEPTIAEALESAARFGLSQLEAKRILREVVRATLTWRVAGKRLGISAKTLDAYASAFEHRLLDEARSLS